MGEHQRRSHFDKGWAKKINIAFVLISGVFDIDSQKHLTLKTAI